MAMDLSGLSGYALEFAKAMNAGKGYDEASAIATKKTGGSGLKRTDVDEITKGTGTTSQSQGVKYDPNTGYAIGDYNSSVRSGGGGQGGGGDNGFNISDIFNAFNRQSSFVAPSESEMRGWASGYANTQVDPMIAAIQNSLTRQLAAQDTARSEVEAQYAGLPDYYAGQLKEARGSALESAIARGMGRSGVVDWQTEKYTNPIIQRQSKDEADKAASLARIANTIAALNTTAQDSIASAEGQRGALEAARMGELQQWAAGMEAAGGQNNFSNMMQMANLYNNNQASSQNLILQLLPLLMGGS